MPLPTAARAFSFCMAIVALLGLSSVYAADAVPRPNVVLVMTDDQGYGDLACHGNPHVRTRNLDRLHAQSVRLTNYHVDPTCSPTRSALMTGRFSSRTGVWHTIQGRSLMAHDEVTIAEDLHAVGYETGIFGKWHLGDNFPCRPQDQGFQHVLIHGGGGVVQTPDYWGNDYFDDTYFRSNDLFAAGKPVKFEGYCTDVWFDNAMEFMAASVEKRKPFFCYIPTNAPHGPFNVADKYADPYRKAGVPESQARFWGMITNIDENMGRLLKWLDERELAENTIVIFTTDNGTAGGAGGPKGFKAGMRGQKGSEYDGGHRVPFFIRWPAGGIGGGRDVDTLAAHVDVRRTLIELCGVNSYVHLEPEDGRSLVPLLREDSKTDWPDRTLFVHSQRVEHPQKWRKSAVMTQRWRLVNGKELYDVQADPGQKKNIAADHPEVVAKLRAEYETWWSSISTRFDDYVRIGLGSNDENPSHLTCHDWHTGDGPVPWNQPSVRNGQQANGFWAVDVTRPGRYEVTLRIRPHYIKDSPPLEATTAKVRLGEVEATQPVAAEARSVTFTLDVPAGPARLQTWLERPGRSAGAYFVDVRRVENAD